MRGDHQTTDYPGKFLIFMPSDSDCGLGTVLMVLQGCFLDANVFTLCYV